MYLYNFEGELVAFAPAFTVKSTTKTVLKESKINLNEKNIRSSYDPLSSARKEENFKKITKVTEGTPGRTDGNLLIQQLGSSASNVTDSFSKTLGRFGIINRDTGDAFCSQLAQDLYDLYKPTV